MLHRDLSVALQERLLTLGYRQVDAAALFMCRLCNPLQTLLNKTGFMQADTQAVDHMAPCHGHLHASVESHCVSFK